MRARLRTLWESRAPRERLVVAVLTTVLVTLLYLWLVQSAERGRVQLKTSVTALRAQAAGLDQQAAEYERLRATPPVTASATDLRALVQAQAGAAGVSRALQRIDAPDANQVQVVLGAVAFADWLNWVAGLQSQQVRLDTCRIEALSTPGLVSVTATFVRAKPQ
jgi:general secretion pathway protein M